MERYWIFKWLYSAQEGGYTSIIFKNKLIAGLYYNVHNGY